MNAKALVPDPRGEQPERFAANEAGRGRISIAVRLYEKEDRPQQPRNPGNVG